MTSIGTGTTTHALSTGATGGGHVVARMSLNEWLEDLCVRFIINLPAEELSSIERICFQIEEAQWFYEDFIRVLDPALPSLNLRQFCLQIFASCPLFSGYGVQAWEGAFEEFLAYKTRVPVRGVIMLDEQMERVLMVRGIKKGASWSFPRGKINKDERDLECAVREVLEETGYNLKEAGLVDLSSIAGLDASGNEGDEDAGVPFIELTIRAQNVKMFVVRGVPLETDFKPLTRGEIGKIDWFKLSDLPTLKKAGKDINTAKHSGHETMTANVHNMTTVEGQQELVNQANKFYMVAPFLGKLKKVIAKYRRDDSMRQGAGLEVVHANAPAEFEAIPSYGHGHPAIQQHPGTDDISRLLGQLRTPATPQLNLQMPPVMQHPDSQFSFPAVRQGPAANPLIEMLRGNQPVMRLPHPLQTQFSAFQNVPQTPAEQVTHTPLMPPPSPKYPSRLLHAQSPQHQHSSSAERTGYPFPMSPPGPMSRGSPRADQQEFGAQFQQSQQNMEAFQQPLSPRRLQGSSHGHRRSISSVQYPLRSVNEPKYSPSMEGPPLVMDMLNRSALPPSAPAQNAPLVPMPRTIPMPAPTQRTFDTSAIAAPYKQTGDKFGEATDMANSMVPSADKLPAPRLNAHSANLLSLFSKAPRPSETAAKQPQVSSQAASLLDLFRKPSDTPPAPGHNQPYDEAHNSLLSLLSGQGQSQATATKQLEATPTVPTSTNSHTTNLLDLFKPRSSQTVQPQGEQFPQRQLYGHKAAKPSFPEQSFAHLPKASPPLATPFSFNDRKNSPLQPIPQSSAQQNALLNLFKSGPSKTTSSASPGFAPELPQKQLHNPLQSELPNQYAELPATSTPTKTEPATLTPKILSGQVKMLKRPQQERKTSYSRTENEIGATVHGPLKYPVFETSQPSSRTHTPAPSSEKPTQQAQQTPIRILARPTTSNGQKETTDGAFHSLQAPAAVSPARATSPRADTKATPKRTIMKKEAAKSSPKMKKEESKSFHPTILKRPISLGPAPEAEREKSNTPNFTPSMLSFENSGQSVADISPPSPSLVATTPSAPLVAPQLEQPPILDRRDSQSQGQKNVLLSLFKKPSTPKVDSAPPGSGDSQIAGLQAQGSTQSTLLTGHTPSPPPAPTLEPVQSQAANASTPRPSQPLEISSNIPMDKVATDLVSPIDALPSPQNKGAPLSLLDSLMGPPKEKSGKTGADDKSFLLGFLNGVVKSGKQS